MENLTVILIVVGTGAGITTVLLVVGGSRAKATRAELGGKIEALTAVVNPMVIEVKETRAKIDTLTGDVKANQAMISALDKKIDQNHNVARIRICHQPVAGRPHSAHPLFALQLRPIGQ